jgi:hypothetical protein
MRTLPAWLLSAAVLAALPRTPAAAGAVPLRPDTAPPAAAGGGPPGAGSEIREGDGQGASCGLDERRVELLAPRPAIPLVAGTTAVLQWKPLPGLASLPAREEWEAFLSLDGGKSYAFRITPHLDSDLQRTIWEVPGVPSADVRLLLRFGDERRETTIELPQRFTITAAPGPLVAALAPRASLARRRGEAARPDDAGVVAWTEGSRRGAGQHQVVAGAAAGLREGLWQPEASRLPVALTVRPVRTGPPAPAHEPAGSLPRDSAGPVAQVRQAPLPPPIDARLQTSRQNE